jgi:uncharacterized iron-regulated membrane protein
MKPDTLRRLHSAHTWAGVSTSWILFIAFFAGSITVFSPEVHEWVVPQARRASAPTAQDVAALVAAVTQAHPPARAEFDISLGHSSQPIASWYSAGERVSAQLADGVLVPPGRTESALSEFILELHYTLGLPGEAGMYLVGIACVIYGLALVAGLLIYVRNLIGDLFAWRAGRNLKQFWRDAHTMVGVLSLPFHITFAYTGAMFTIFVLMAAGLDRFALQGRAAPLIEHAFEVAPAPEPGGEAATPLHPAVLIAAAKRVAPSLRPTFFSYRHYGDANGTVQIYGQVSGALIQQGSIVLNSASGALIGASVPGRMHPANAASGTMLALHYGRFGGFVTRWMYFGLGLAGAFLFYSGALLWIESRRRRQAGQPRLHRSMARLTVGLCIGSCLGLAVTFAANQLPVAWFATDLGVRVVYGVFWLGSVIFAWCRPPIRAAIELLYATAAFALALPILNAIASGDHLLRSAAEGHWAVFWFDMTALAVGMSFLLLARAVARRARAGERNSVWAAPAEAPANSESEHRC